MGMNKELSENSNNSYIRVSHNQKIKEQENLIRELEEREGEYKRQIDEYMERIGLLTEEIEKIKKELEEYMMKAASESTLNELETLKVVVGNQKEEIDNKVKVVNQLKEEMAQMRPEL